MPHYLKYLNIVFFLIAAAAATAGEASAASAHEGHSAEQQVKQYYCPMHPQVVSDRPGECPICHMRLVLRTADASADVAAHGPGHAVIRVPSERQQLIGLKTGAVRKMSLTRSLTVPGRVVYDPELYEAQIQYLTEDRASRGSLRNREATYRNLSVSKWEAPRVEKARARLTSMGMDAASIEELVSSAKADDRLLYLSPEGEVWVYAEVFVQDSAVVKKGDPVDIRIPSIPDASIRAAINDISPVVDPSTQTLRLRILARSEQGLLKPGMWVDVFIRTGLGERLAVPQEAVLYTGDTTLVFVDKGEGRFEHRPVVLGPRAEGYYTVEKGLHEGESVVTSANFLIDSESRLQAALGNAGHSHGAAS